MTQHIQCFFWTTLQLFGQSKQLGYADTLNDTDIYLPRKHLGAFILEKLLEFMHEHDKIQGIKPGIDEVVRFRACEVVPGFQHVERRSDLRMGRAYAGVLLPRKIEENGKPASQPPLFGLMAHDFARTGSRYRTRRYEGDQRHFHVEITPYRRGNLPRVRQ